MDGNQAKFLDEDLSGIKREIEFLQAINQAAATIQRSSRSEEDVLEAFCTQIDNLNLVGLICELDATKENLIIRAAAHSSHNLQVYEQLSGLTIQGFKFPVQQADSFREGVRNGHSLYLPNANETISQITPRAAKFLLKKLIQSFGNFPVILSPLKVEAEIQGILCVVGAKLKPADTPAIEAFANHIAVALGNARLFAATRQAENRYQTLFETSTDAIFIETIKGQVLDCNETACQMFGYTREEFLGLSATDLVSEEIARSLSDYTSKIERTGWLFLETINKRKDGSLFPVQVSIRAMELGGDERIVVYVRDISERQQTEITIESMENALKRRAEEFKSLYAVSLEITATHDLSILLEAIVEQAVQLLNGSEGGFYLCDPERQEVRCVVSYQTKRNFTGTVLKYGEGLAGKVAISGTPLIIDDYRTWPGRADIYELEQPFCSILSAPVIWQGQVSGVLHVLDSENRQFTTDDLNLLTLLANQAAIAIENSRLLEGEHRRRLEAETLRQVTTLLTTALELNPVLDNILTCLEQVIPYDSAAVFLLDDEQLYCQAARGIPNSEAVIGKAYTLDNPLLFEIHRSKSSLILEDAQNDPRFEKWGGTDYVRSWMGLPLIISDRVIGFLTCDHRQIAIYKARDAISGEMFANQAAIAIQNARLFEAERSQLLLSKTLQEVGALLTSELGLNDVLEKILDLLGRVIHYDSASIHLIDLDGKNYLAAGRGFEGIEKAPQTVPQISDHELQANMTETVIVIPDTHAYERWSRTQTSDYIRSWVGVQLLVKGEFIGSLNLENCTVNAYDEAIGNTVMAFANQAAIAIENARLFEAERQRVAELEVARQATLSLTASLELSQVLKAILSSALSLLPNAQNSHIFLYDANADILSSGAALFADGSEGQPWSKPRAQGLTYTVARTGEAIVVPDMRDHPIYEGTPADWNGSIIGLPLIFSSRVVGVMNVSFHQPRKIPENELRLLRFLADQAAIAIENARLYEQAATERSHLGLLYDVSRAITSSLEPDEIFQRAITLTCQALGGISGQAYLYNPDEERLSLRAIFGHTTMPLAEADVFLDMHPGKGLTGWVTQHRQAVISNNITENPHWLHIPGFDDEVQSAIITPILAEDKLLGALNVYHRQLAAFTTEHLNLMEAISQEVGLALTNAHRYQQVQRRLTEITLIQNLTQTYNHSLEVKALLYEVVAQLNDNLGYSQITIFLVADNNLVLKASHGKPPQESTYPLSKGIIGKVARSGQSAFVPDLSIDLDYYRHPGEEFVSEIAVPIFRNQDVVGVISIQSEHKDQLTSQDHDLLEVLAGQISVALENAILYERAREHADDLEVTVNRRTAELTELYNLSQEIGYALSYEELLLLLIQHLQKAISSKIVVGCLFTEDTHSFRISVDRPISQALIAEIQTRCLHKLKFSMDRASHQVIRADGYDQSQPELQEIASFLLAPILLDQERIGVLALVSDRAQAFGTEQERLLTTFANQASSAAARLGIFLSVQQKQLESLVEHLPVGVLLLDADFNILVANPPGRGIISLLNAEEDKTFNTVHKVGPLPVQELIDHENALIPTEITLKGPPKRVFSAQIKLAGGPVDENRENWVLTVSEITQERENIERTQVQERLATVGQLAAGIAHDFNNIMAAILVYTDLLRYDPSIPPPSQEKLAIIQQQVERASSLIRQILDFSRKSVMELNPFDLLPLVKELDKMLSRVLPETIQLELAYQTGDYLIYGDPTRIQQVFMNLALNARDAMPEGGKLVFAIDKYSLQADVTPPHPYLPPGEWIRITVTDTGDGIPVEVQEHIFEPFFTTKPVGQGTGLGLAQVYGIVKQHEGYIVVHSQVGVGSSFTIFLPSLRIRNEESQDQPRRLESTNGFGQTVLVVEDDPTTLQALQSLLEVHGYQVFSARNGKAALELLEQTAKTVDLVVSDIVMPEMGGLALFNSLKRHYPKTKVLLISGHPLEEENQSLLVTAQVHWLQKPFRVPEFIQMVRTLLENQT